MHNISWGRRFYWSLRRELWEVPALWAAPLAGSAVVLVTYVYCALRGVRTVVSPTTFAVGAVMGGTYVVAIFYALDTLYGERKDRSILFWKSLPVSDVVTVMAKVAIPFVVAPLIGFAITEATLLILMLLGSSEPEFMRRSVLLLYHLFAVHSLWWAPFFGWLFLISAWTRRTPFVWAALPVMAVALIEHMTMNTDRFYTMLLKRLSVSPDAIVPRNGWAMDPMTHMTPGALLSSVDLWTGIAVAALCLFAAVRLRKHHGPL